MSQLAGKTCLKQTSRRRYTDLPASLRPLFWEYAFEALSWNEDRDLVIAKVLEGGTWDDICWLRKALTREELRAWIIAKKGRGLDERRLSYWGLMLGIPDRMMLAWTRKLKRNPWHGRANP